MLQPSRKKKPLPSLDPTDPPLSDHPSDTDIDHDNDNFKGKRAYCEICCDVVYAENLEKHIRNRHGDEYEIRGTYSRVNIRSFFCSRNSSMLE